MNEEFTEAAHSLERDLIRNDIHIQATYRLTEALSASEKKLRRRIELLFEVIFETDAAGALSFLNPAWTDTLGHSVESSLGFPLRHFVLPEDRELLDRRLSAGCCTRDRLTLRFLHRDGATVWMDLSSVALEEGGFVGALHNVTEQRLAQMELAKLSLVASYTGNLVIITDGRGRTEWVNQAFTRKTGYALDEVAGRTPGSLLQGPETDPATVALLQQGLREGRSIQCEILNYAKTGEPYWVAMHITPIRNSRGDVERFVSVQSDVTELRLARQELKTAKEAAEAASEAKTQFLATISHEMRTPLNVILGTAEIAIENGRDRESIHYLSRINENAENLLGLISDLLDVSKIEAGQCEWERVPFPLRVRLRQSLAPIAERAIRKGLDFQVIIDDQLPDTVLGDPARLRQIVANLAENAVKFTDSGFVRVEATRAPNGTLLVRVTDSGAGIPASAQPRIFDRFFQGDGSTTRRKGGAGLGLSIVKSLVDAMGGSVSVSNSPGAGAEFRLLLPLEPVVEAPPSPLPSPVDPRCAGSILVAEDNDDNFTIVQRHLTNNGYRVERAINGHFAVAAAARSRFDLILMDIEMPEMDGLQATQRIRAAERGSGRSLVPILALTAHAVQGYRERCLAVGCTGYLAKPIRKQGLLEGVAAALADSPA